MNVQAPSPVAPVRQEWLDRRTEPVIDPELPIVDPHHHLFDRPGWRYLLDELLADLNSGHTIIATVFLEWHEMHHADGPEPLRPVGETEFVNGIAAMSASGGFGPARICEGIVGHADLRLGAAVDEVIEAHIRAGGGRFRGIRHRPGDNPGPHLFADPRFREGFARLAPLGLSFDAGVFHPQIGELTALARAFPATPIVLNHLGGPVGAGSDVSQHDAVFAQWVASIRELATCPNVMVKVGGLGMPFLGFTFHEQPDPPSSEQLAAAYRPYFDVCIDAFGSNRCMFESNFPVDKQSYSYAVFWNACKRLTQGASDTERANLFRRTAAHFYRLALPDGL